MLHENAINKDNKILSSLIKITPGKQMSKKVLIISGEQISNNCGTQLLFILIWKFLSCIQTFPCHSFIT